MREGDQSEERTFRDEYGRGLQVTQWFCGRSLVVSEQGGGELSRLRLRSMVVEYRSSVGANRT